MTQYAYFNSAAAAPAKVIGWYDTGSETYANLPAASDLLTLTAAQWTASRANPDGWAVSAGALVAYTPPVPAPTLAQQATAALSAGLAITLSGTLTLAETAFPVDPVTTGKIGAVVTTVVATKAFPGGATAYPMKDAAGNWHTFTIAQYTIVAAAIAAYAASLDLIADGNPLNATALPANSVTLTV